MRWMLALVLSWSMSFASLHAEDRTIDLAIPLKTPRKGEPRQGGPLDKVEMSLWVPEDVKTVRGVMINPFYQGAVKQQHWQAACRQWGFAVIGANYFGVRDNEFKDTMLSALKEAAQQLGRKELEHVPMLFVGMSAGAGMSVRFAELMPERTIAVGPVCLEVGPRSVPSYSIPMLTIFGEKDGGQMKQLTTKLPTLRQDGAQWSIAVQWGRRHEFGRANNLLQPMFDAAISQRYPIDADPSKGPVTLKTIDETTGWLGDPDSWTTGDATIAPWAKYQGDRKKACWFPDEHTAHAWRAFVTAKPKVALTSPLGQGDSQPFVLLSSNKELVTTAKVDASLDGTVELFAGAKSLGKLSKGEGQYTLTLPGISPGIHALYVVTTTADGKRHYSQVNTVVVQK